MRLPLPRGPISTAVIDCLRGTGYVDPSLERVVDPLADDDLQLGLWIIYELHYRGFDEVADCWEWDATLLDLQRQLESRFHTALRAQVRVPLSPARVADRLRDLVDVDDGPSLARYMQTDADRDQWLEFVMHRSVYQLKEADPHSWAIPRLPARAKAALVEIQVDEYGGGDAAAMHSELFRTVLTELGLSDQYGAYVDAVPGITLALSNIMSLFGLQRALRGALVGHLAAYEMTSSAPCRRYAKGLRRLGAGDAACAFYDVHVTADALHEQLAAHDLCGGLAEAEPALTEDIVFGAAACLHLDKRFAQHLLDSWDRGRTSLHEVRELVTAES